MEMALGGGAHKVRDDLNDVVVVVFTVLLFDVTSGARGKDAMGNPHGALAIRGDDGGNRHPLDDFQHANQLGARGAGVATTPAPFAACPGLIQMPQAARAHQREEASTKEPSIGGNLGEGLAGVGACHGHHVIGEAGDQVRRQDAGGKGVEQWR